MVAGPKARPLAFFFLALALLALAPPLLAQEYPLDLIIGIEYPDAELNADREHAIVIRGNICTVSLRIKPKIYFGGRLLFSHIEVLSTFLATVELYHLTIVMGYHLPHFNVMGFRTDCAGEARVYVEGIEIAEARLVTLTIRDKRDADTYRVRKARERPQGGGGVAAVFGSMLEFIASTLGTFVQTVVVGVRSIGEVVGGGLRVLGEVVGKPGDPMAQIYAAQYRLALLQYVNSPIREDIEAVLNCAKPLREVRGLIPTLRDEDADKTICQVENSAPRGIVGFMSTLWFAITASGKVLEIIARYFVVINATIFTAVLAWGGAASIRRRDPEPLITAVKIIYGIIKFYFNVAVFLLKLGLLFVEAISQAVSAVIGFFKGLLSWLL